MNFFAWIYESTSQEINIPRLLAKFNKKTIAELDTVTVSGRSFKIYSPCLILAWVWAILISVGLKLEALSLVKWLSVNDRCQL